METGEALTLEWNEMHDSLLFFVLISLSELFLCIFQHTLIGHSIRYLSNIVLVRVG